ncbi:thioesterase II family protein [Streptomyces marianii]|uniref:Thioesterase n=1 Tax=Streptomyces marianii TaxID=1817406 RepID=A0A5R9E943_9ACTN|nr:alpha/beta fold hydrolase [Streptomyces marianii]TLQ44533.1 thioesterase [Streptomyces marianii]
MSDRRPLVIALPYAGGGAAAFTEWRTVLDADCAVLPVHLPGRERRFQERPYRRMTHLVRDLVEEVGPLMNRRVVFWGHSMGAAVSVALALELARQGFPPPAHVLVSGAGSPDRRDAKDLVHVLDDARLAARLRQYEGTPREVLENPDLLGLVLPVIRADFELLETWSRPRPAPLPAPLTVLYGEDDRSVSAHQVDGWLSYSDRPVARRPFAGGHFFIRAHVAEVAQILRELAVGPGA